MLSYTHSYLPTYLESDMPTVHEYRPILILLCTTAQRSQHSVPCGQCLTVTLLFSFSFIMWSIESGDSSGEVRSHPSMVIRTAHCIFPIDRGAFTRLDCAGVDAIHNRVTPIIQIETGMHTYMTHIRDSHTQTCRAGELVRLVRDAAAPRGWHPANFLAATAGSALCVIFVEDGDRVKCFALDRGLRATLASWRIPFCRGHSPSSDEPRVGCTSSDPDATNTAKTSHANRGSDIRSNWHETVTSATDWHP